MNIIKIGTQYINVEQMTYTDDQYVSDEGRPVIRVYFAGDRYIALKDAERAAFLRWLDSVTGANVIARAQAEDAEAANITEYLKNDPPSDDPFKFGNSDY